MAENGTFIDTEVDINAIGNEKPLRTQRDRGICECALGYGSHILNPTNT